ncbi:MAG: glycosyltransferase [Ilumatobacteraceae bacterium]
MTGRRLVLVTQSYPFGEHVDFLEDEIEHLAAAFDEVLIAPFAPAGARQGVPPNVGLDLTVSVRVRARHQRIVAGLRTRLGRRLIGCELRAQSAPRRHPESAARLLAAAGLAAETARWAAGIGPALDTIAMTVWLGAPTVGLGAAGLRTVSRAHRGDLYADLAPHGYLPLQAAALDACVLVLPVADHGRRQLAHDHPAFAARLRTRRLGVADAAGRAAWSTDGVTRIVSCSNLVPVKRPHLLVDVVEALGSDGAPVEWHHFGSGPLADDFAAQLRRLPPNITAVAHGQVANEVVRAHYAAHPVDAFVNVSSSEGVPVTMMEAISAGVPIVATDVGGVGEIIGESTGALVDPDASAATIAAEVRREVAAGRFTARRAQIHAAWERCWSSSHNYTSFAGELAELARGQQ